MSKHWEVQEWNGDTYVNSVLFNSSYKTPTTMVEINIQENTTMTQVTLENGAFAYLHPTTQSNKTGISFEFSPLNRLGWDTGTDDLYKGFKTIMNAKTRIKIKFHNYNANDETTYYEGYVQTVSKNYLLSGATQLFKVRVSLLPL